MLLEGPSIVFGDNVNTGIIVSAKYMSRQGDPKSLIPYMFEAVRPGLHTSLPGAILVGGANFGVGSTREIVPILLREVGVRAVVARSFSRGFFRNAINLGLPLVETDTAGIREGDLLSIDLDAGQVANRTTGAALQALPLPEIMQRILFAGGLVPFFQRYKTFA